MAGSPNHPIHLIGKLIRLATNNPNEQEAAAAALKACKLMIQHKAVITLPGESLPNNPWGDLHRAQEAQRHYNAQYAAQRGREVYERMRKEKEQEAQRKVKEAEERAQQWADEMKSRAKKPAQSHAFHPQTMRCKNCGVTAADFHRMGGNLPCYG
jgi:hypothetical protein